MTRHNSQRGWFFHALYNLMEEDNRIWVITADLGYGALDKIRDDFPERFYNVGASEQAMLGIGCGLAMEGKIPFLYSITPFLLYRPFEWIRNYVNHESIPVKLVGGGLDTDYEVDGFTHHATDARAVMDLFENIKCYWPGTLQEAEDAAKSMATNGLPSFIALRR